MREPPKLPQKLLEHILQKDLQEEILGDLEEQYRSHLKKTSHTWAKLTYWYQVLHYLRPFALRSDYFNQIHPFYMIRHNIKFAFRQFQREKSTFLINLVGLAAGLACTLLISLWVWDELSFDAFHDKKDQLYQVLQRVPQNSEEILTWKWTPGLLAQTLKEEFPQVESSTPITTLGSKGILVKGDTRQIAKERYVGEDFFHMFSFPVLRGNPQQIFPHKHSVVLTRDLALKVFGSLDGVLGQAIEWERNWREVAGQFIITGIIENPPTHSTLQFEILFSYDFYLENKSELLEWYNSDPQTMIALKEGTDVAQFEQKIESLVQQKLERAEETLFLQKFSNRYLYNQFKNGEQAGGRIEYVYLFSAIALFILFIACINFMNLSTAKATRRFKEIGVKKSLGANRKTLMGQYLSESLLLTFLAFIVALVFAQLILPQFNMLTGKSLALSFDSKLVFTSLSILLFTGILAGSYPALYLSQFSPVNVLKGKLQNSLGELWVRKGLVVFQFSLSILLIVAVLVVYRQIQFIQSKNLGFNKDNVAILQKVGSLEEDMETFLTEVKQVPGVINASTMDTDMVGNYGHTTALFWEGNEQKENPIRFGVIIGGKELIETLGMEMLEGQTFAEEGANQGGFIFNEAAIEAMGLENPIGKMVTRRRYEHPIVGVVKNFHFESLYEGVRPCYLRRGNYGDNIVVKIQAGKERETLAQLKMIFQSFNPGLAFRYKFLDENFDQLYAGERQVATLAKYAAVMAILISCLGLFGLAAFTVQRRTKEIGIRKVLGATAFGIVQLLSLDFTRMVLVALCIAIPTSWILAKSWLNSFAFRIDLSSWVFILAGALALLIAWLTVSIQTFRAARTNPVEALRSE
ncbi:MAG: FtsX-like permease family protein [Bacteroidota bacterium]